MPMRVATAAPEPRTALGRTTPADAPPRAPRAARRPMRMRRCMCPSAALPASGSLIFSFVAVINPMRGPAAVGCCHQNQPLFHRQRSSPSPLIDITQATIPCPIHASAAALAAGGGAWRRNCAILPIIARVRMGLHGIARRLGTRFFSSSMPRADGPSRLRVAVIGAGPGGLALSLIHI